MLQLIIIAVYLAGMVALGLWSRRKSREADDFYVAGRKGSTLFITGSLLATIIGGSAIMVTSSLGFTRGLSGIWWLLVGSIGLIVLGIFFARKVREFGLYTLPEMIEKQYDKRVAFAGSILIVVAWIGIIASQIIAAGRIMGVLGIGSPMLWMVTFTVVFVVYTMFGGQHAIIRTDTVQTVIIFAGIFITLALVLSNLGGIGGFIEKLPSEQFSFPLGNNFGAYDLFNLLILVGLTYVVGPDMYSRLLCAKDGGVAKKSAIWTAVLIIPVALAITVIGMGAPVLFPGTAAGEAFPTIINGILPPFVAGIVLAALLCAFMSSADTTLLTASTILSVDVIGQLNPSVSREKSLIISRWGILVLGAASLALALYMDNIISTMLFAYTVYTGGLIIPILAGFYRDKLKVTAPGALVAIIGGGATALIAKLMMIKYLDLGSLLVSLVLLFAVSYLDKKCKNKKI